MILPVTFPKICILCRWLDYYFPLPIEEAQAWCGLMNVNLSDDQTVSEDPMCEETDWEAVAPEELLV